MSNKTKRGIYLESNIDIKDGIIIHSEVILYDVVDDVREALVIHGTPKYGVMIDDPTLTLGEVMKRGDLFDGIPYDLIFNLFTHKYSYHDDVVDVEEYDLNKVIDYVLTHTYLHDYEAALYRLVKLLQFNIEWTDIYCDGYQTRLFECLPDYVFWLERDAKSTNDDMRYIRYCKRDKFKEHKARVGEAMLNDDELLSNYVDYGIYDEFYTDEMKTRIQLERLSL